MKAITRWGALRATLFARSIKQLPYYDSFRGSHMSLILQKSAALLAFAITLTACGGDSTSPSTDPPAGNYNAIQFVTTGSSGQRDELMAGGSLQLELDPDHTTSGHLHVAASSNGPVFDADMAGTWTVTGNVVTVSQPADTFVRNMPFTLELDPVNGYVLLGDKTFSSTRIQITLKRATCPAC
jgi:hypothetical protein